MICVWIDQEHGKDSYLRLVVWHMLHKRLIRKLLGAICNVLCRVSRWSSYNWRACCGGRMHHGALVVLVLPLLGHIWYWKTKICLIRNTEKRIWSFLKGSR